MNFRGYIIILCCFLSNAIFGQFNNFKFENLDTADGLSSSTCLEIFQDKEGFLWFGTIDGINKYNGYEFEIYRSVLNDTTSISNNRINTIEEDKEGNLWIGTSNGLNFFNKKTNSFVRVNLYKQISLSNNPRKIINDLFYDEDDNTLWVATKNGIIKIILEDVYQNIENLKFSYYTNDESDLHSLDNNSVNVILKDKDNVIWLGTGGQYLNRYNSKQDNFERVYIASKKPYELNHIPKMVFNDSDNDFWIGNDLSNLILWNKEEDSFRHMSFIDYTVSIRDLYQDKNGLIWASTDGEGLFLLDKNENKILQHITNNLTDDFSLPNNKPSKIFEDKDGIFWIGSYDKGVSKLDLSQNSFGHYYYQPDNPNGLSEKIVQSVLQDSKERIWLSTYDGGLNLFDEKNNSFQHYSYSPNNPNSLSSNKILYTFETHDGNIWVCTLDGGLNKFNPETTKVERFLHDERDSLSIGQNSVWSGVEDSKNRLWLGLRTEGLNLFDPTTKKFYNYKNTSVKENSLVSNFVFFLFIDSKNRLLVGTSLGLNYVDLDNIKDFIPEEIDFLEVNEKGIEGNNINHIIEDHLGNIWIGTDSGIYKLDEDLNLVKSYSSQNGLPNNLVVGIKEDVNNNFWVTTRSGLSMLNPKTHQFKNFNIHDGLQGTEYQSKSIEKTKNGRIIVGGINGFNIFSPSDISLKTPTVLTPRITAFKLYNKNVIVGDTINNRVLLKKPIQETKELKLKYKENYISFEFLALYFENQEQVQYAYKMYGLDEEFVNIGTGRDVNYSNLLPGDYTFEVKASTSGEWEDAQTSKINFEIMSPPWKTWWAYMLYFIVGSGVFFIIARYYTQKVQEKQEHELDQMKLQFFVNVSHEFRTPLTLILNPVDKILSSFNYDSETIKESALSIQRSSRRLLHLVDQLLDYRKMDAGMAPLQLEKGDIITFSKDIFSLFKGLAAKKEIDYRFNTAFKSINSLFDFDKVEKIITNLISNAIKYTNSGGKITVSINKISQKKSKSSFLFFKKEKLGDFVEIIIKDTGIGLNKEQIKNIFYRFYNVDITKTGTGIGLNFTKAIVEMHGGEIFVESQHLKGSKFIVRLPLNIKAEPDIVENVKNEFLINSMKSVEYEMLTSNNELTTVSESKNSKESNKKKPTILLVEDNKELRIHIKNDLKYNYIVKEAVNGEEGLKMVKKYYPDIVVSDVMMPAMDGFEMCKLIKTELETCHIPVILLTARTLEEDRVEGYENGADGYLSKPFVMSVLMARIDNLLEAKNRLKKRFSEIGGGVFASNEVTTNNLDEAFLDKATRIVLKNINDVDFKQEHLLKEMSIGRSQFYRKINSLTGNNPSYFIRTIRLRYASELLMKNNYSIKEVTHMSGFNSTAYFSKTFRELFGLTPSDFIEKKQPLNEENNK
ncbi:two-component regulator propeller domain-containing protein [Flavivirga aquimarina]|uniref:histidine kinase n=1 Tax=Flavivirga aquimarina TaxID=2027862 RepID=A0ABT8WF24_9FLAO|nr:two-component regulator propeller domain-containing protein [Flavivirga aquimarina]MDO5971758.1 two-component regulator propeller domain-containing protein [Flavivirga aquimarina]